MPLQSPTLHLPHTRRSLPYRTPRPTTPHTLHPLMSHTCMTTPPKTHPPPTPPLRPLHRSCIFLLLFPPHLHIPKLSHLRIARIPIPYLLTPNPCFLSSRIYSSLYLAFAVEVGAGYVETVDVPGEDAGDEEKGV
jgi:hypothetical protein